MMEFSMQRIKSRLLQVRWWFLTSFILSSLFIGGNSLVSSEESSDLSTGVSEVIINVARAILPPGEVVITPATALTLSLKDQATSIYLGTSNRITATFDPLTTSDKGLTWTTSDAQIIDITNGGIAVARNLGFATIRATTKTDNVFGELQIEVIDFPSLTSFEMEARIGETVVTTIEKETTAKIAITNPFPTNAKREGVSFISSNPNIATVSDEGIIKGIAVGTSEIEAFIGNFTKTISIEIVDLIEVTQPTTFNLTGPEIGYVGRPFSLSVDFGLTTPTDTQTTFTSSDTKIARVNDLGLITAINFAGYESKTVTIVAFSNTNPNLRDEVLITIEKVFPVGLSIATGPNLEAGRTINISPTFNPVDVTDRQLTYRSSNPEIATVNSAGDFGVILGKTIGTVTITATSVMDPTIEATLRIDIIPASLLTQDMIQSIYLFVRKGIGHIGLNFLNGILGFLTFYTFAVTNKKRDYLILTFVVGLGLAFIFEGLQYFAPGRSPTFVDVVYNFIGYAFAQLLMLSVVSVLDVRHFKALIKQKRINNKPAS
jgi:uncharacterized protein YjdB/VanZ family protein